MSHPPCLNLRWTNTLAFLQFDSRMYVTLKSLTLFRLHLWADSDSFPLLCCSCPTPTFSFCLCLACPLFLCHLLPASFTHITWITSCNRCSSNWTSLVHLSACLTIGLAVWLSPSVSLPVRLTVSMLLCLLLNSKNDPECDWVILVCLSSVAKRNWIRAWLLS